MRQSGVSSRTFDRVAYFTSEEPTRFESGVWEQATVGNHVSRCSKKTDDNDGATLDEVRHVHVFGGELEQVKLPTGYYKAFIELHIEQTAVGAPANSSWHSDEDRRRQVYEFLIEGSGGHAGGVLMPDRHVLSAPQPILILAIESAAAWQWSARHGCDCASARCFPVRSTAFLAVFAFSVDIRDTDLQAARRSNART